MCIYIYIYINYDAESVLACQPHGELGLCFGVGCSALQSLCPAAVDPKVHSSSLLERVLHAGLLRWKLAMLLFFYLELHLGGNLGSTFLGKRYQMPSVQSPSRRHLWPQLPLPRGETVWAGQVTLAFLGLCGRWAMPSHPESSSLSAD